MTAAQTLAAAKIESSKQIDASLSALIEKLIRALGEQRNPLQRPGLELLGRLREFYGLPDDDQDDASAFNALANLVARYISENLNPPESPRAVLTFGAPVPI